MRSQTAAILPLLAALVRVGPYLAPRASALARGAVLGLGAAAPIGPVNVEIARRTLRQGFAAGFALGCGAVTADVFYAVATSLSLTAADNPVLTRLLAWGGVVLLTYLGASSLRAAVRHCRADPITAAAPHDAPRTRASAGAAYATGLMMTLLNPMTLALWFAVVPAAVGPITEEPARDLPMICAGVFLGTISWVCGFAGLLGRLGRYRRAAWVAGADGVGGLVLLGFAAAGVWRMCRGHL